MKRYGLFCIFIICDFVADFLHFFKVWCFLTPEVLTAVEENEMVNIKSLRKKERRNKSLASPKLYFKRNIEFRREDLRISPRNPQHATLEVGESHWKKTLLEKRVSSG